MIRALIIYLAASTAGLTTASFLITKGWLNPAITPGEAMILACVLCLGWATLYTIETKR